VKKRSPIASGKRCRTRERPGSAPDRGTQAAVTEKAPRGLDDMFRELEKPDDRKEVRTLFANLKRSRRKLERLLAEWDDSEDGVYRFYHQSWKVYDLQESTKRIVAALSRLLPGRPLNDRFAQIVKEGTGKEFEHDHNERWLEVTRPILEAFFHARYFLEMAVKYAADLEAPPRLMPSGWAALLYLYGLR
jgi:hypothetical protein